MRWIGFLLGLFAGLFVASGFADDFDSCANQSGQQGIAACSRVIASGKAGGRLASAHYNRGLAWLEMGDHDRAIADFNISARLDPRSAWTFNNRGTAYYAKGDLDSALADFSKAIELDPTYAKARNNRAEAFKDKGDWPRAVADYTEAIRLDPGYTAAYANRGVAYERSGDLERARADFAAALALTPKYGDGRAAQDTARAHLAALATTAPRPDQTDPNIRPVRSDRRIALVIGNSNYAAAFPLANAGRDARVVAAALREAGFQSVTLAPDLSHDQLVSALATFAREAAGADWAIVYFAGHGLEVSGTNYLVPIDASLESERDVPFQAVALDQVMAAVNGARKLRLIVLDACRNNPFVARMRLNGGTRGTSRGFMRPAPVNGTLVAFAAKHGETALDDSPFATTFAKHLATPGIEINRLFRLVRDDVMDATGGQQEPYTYGSLPAREEYYFVAK